MSLLRSISMSPLHKRRQRRSRLGTMCSEGPDGMDLREVEGEGDEGKGLRNFPLTQSLNTFQGYFVLFFNVAIYNQAVGNPWSVTPRWSNLGALTGMQAQMEALMAWLTVRVLKGEPRKWMTAKNESENLTGLVRDLEFFVTCTASI